MFIDFRELPEIPRLIKDFLNQETSVLGGKNFSIANIENQIELKKQHFSTQKRQLLHSGLEKQLSSFELSEKQSFNLQNLANENTFCVTTGHQLNLFTGPAFFIYKIMQCIKTCEFLKEHFPNNHFVPLFWMATEDHDFEEINHFSSGGKTYKTNAKSGGAVGRILLEDLSFLQNFQKDHAFAKYFDEINALMTKVFKKGKSLTEITQILVHELFSNYGLLMIDGDDAEFKKALIPAIKKEIFQEELFRQTQKNRDYITQKYTKVQVQPREINLFYLNETRNRIVKNEGVWEVLNTDIKFTEEQISLEIENHPERFSPNSLLRPVYQEELLPNLAYIGGNAEIMYWLELADYFIASKLPFPVVIPRQSFLFINENLDSKLKKSGLEILDFFLPKDQSIRKKLLKDHSILEELTELKHQLEKQFQKLRETAKKSDITFEDMLNAEEKRQLKSFGRLEKRLLRAEKIKHSEYLHSLDKLFENLHPNGVWQERKINFSEFYLEKSTNWLDICYAKINVENCGLNIVVIR